MINKDSVEVEEILLGSTSINKVYQGTTKI